MLSAPVMPCLSRVEVRAGEAVGGGKGMWKWDEGWVVEGRDGDRVLDLTVCGIHTDETQTGQCNEGWLCSCHGFIKSEARECSMHTSSAMFM